FGSGTNSLTITNNDPLCGGCTLTTSIENFSHPVLLSNGGVASNVIVDSAYTAFTGLGGTNTLSVNGPSGAVLALDGATSHIYLGAITFLGNLVIPSDNGTFNTPGTYVADSLSLNSGGVVSGNARLVVLGATAWTAGTMTGTGTTTLN